MKTLPKKAILNLIRIMKIAEHRQSRKCLNRVKHHNSKLIKLYIGRKYNQNLELIELLFLMKAHLDSKD